ncbi:MAG TPA: UTP--glucose-1-phosphate uridylyltransferase GalU [Patescibacteria group bacterium]|nr:UTP--glucose-1-phosphate uridylyltransferase GalU [Patescibacteria group bacterium]
MKIIKAILPVAGLGTRFLPITKAQPKEMLPIVDKPILHYLVEEAVNSGIEEIIIVTGRGKRSIEDYFDYSIELESNLVEKGKEGLLAEVRAIPNLAKIAYVRQPMPLGDGHAILCAAHLVGDEPIAVLFGDDIIDSEKPALAQMMKVFEKTRSPVICVEEVPAENISSYGVIDPESSDGNIYKIKGLVEKPKQGDAPSNLGIVGKYIVTPEVLECLKEIEKKEGEEIRLIDGFRRYIEKGGSIYGYKFEGKRYDTGDKWGWIKATIDYTLKREDLGKKLKDYLKEIK